MYPATETVCVCLPCKGSPLIKVYGMITVPPLLTVRRWAVEFGDLPSGVWMERWNRTGCMALQSLRPACSLRTRYTLIERGRPNNASAPDSPPGEFGDVP